MRAAPSARSVVCTTVMPPRASPAPGAWARASAMNRSTCACKKRLVPNWRMGWTMAVTGSDFNNGLDHALLRVEQGGKGGRHIGQGHAVGVEGVGGHLASAHGAQHGFEVFGGGVAAAQQGGFALVELGVGEADGVAHHRDQHVLAAMGHKAKAALNGFGIAGGIEHQVKELVLGGSGQLGLIALPQGHGARHAQLALAEVEAVLAAVEGGDFGTAQAGEDHGGHADGPAPTTSTRWPACTRPRRTAWAPMARNSTMAAWSSVTPSALCTKASGSDKYSVKAPSRCTPSTWMLTQQLVLPCRQATHWPHDR